MFGEKLHFSLYEISFAEGRITFDFGPCKEIKNTIVPQVARRLFLFNVATIGIAVLAELDMRSRLAASSVVVRTGGAL